MMNLVMDFSTATLEDKTDYTNTHEMVQKK